ncbi:M15 family metallopeptidase [Deinococcus peraridilitoris]|uniref:D-alanyl-D-alanine carboxypeptidase n=1 Tax=Deinococcus peraridilitoris (strain DSM 19664 / LMG 22246 / CIP 109416 / KR-200) TaxID=937777 RepID=L0A1B1_DEIPD|nr:M15 family metallopeptidase [Deinococcus peraridilitoris]AFZ66972.1 D-alanyl-D-alanine carboxypeptidase [Deinococcus peraridilitoris DSM 19664]
MKEPKQNRNLDDLNPLFRAPLERWLAAAKKAGFTVLVYETFRTLERQRYLYACGRTVAPIGRILTYTLDSAHRYGMACDLVPLHSNGTANWNGYAALYKAVPPSDYGLETLSFEQPHLQLAGVNGPKQNQSVKFWAARQGVKCDVVVGSKWPPTTSKA